MLRSNKFITYILLAMLLLAILMIYAVHFNGRNYRQDEAWVIHHAMVDIEQEGLIGHVLSVFNSYTPENFTLDIWVGLFGHFEPITRFLSTLYTALALAVLYRMATDLFDRQTGILSIIFLGTLNFFLFFAQEARPYSALAFDTIAFQWASLRYVQHPRRSYAALIVLFATLGLYQHSFMLYVIAAQAIFTILFVRWNADLASNHPEESMIQRMRHTVGIQIIGLYAIVGILYLPRFLLINSAANYTGGIGYGLPTAWDSLQILYDQMHVRPEAIGLLLLLTGLFIPVSKIFPDVQSPALRFSREWRKWYLLLMPLSMLILTFIINDFVRSITPRNMIILLPSLAIFVAFAVRNLPWQARVVTVLLIAIPFVNDFQPIMGNNGYGEMAEIISEQYDPEEGKLVVWAGQLWEHVPIIYAMQERTPFGFVNEDLFHIVSEQKEHYSTIPDPPVNIVWQDRPEEQQALRDYLGDAHKLWMIKGNPWGYGETYLEMIAERYVPLRTTIIEGETYYYPFEITEYRRIPDDIQILAGFGDALQLQAWQVADVQVHPCQTIAVESWWIAPQEVHENYSMTMVIADNDGNGIVNTDGAPSNILTGLWEADQLYVDERPLTIPCDLEPGEYSLLTGIYLPETGERLGDLSYLTTLFVGGN